MNIVLEDKLYLDPTEDMNSVTKKSLEKLMLEIFAELEKSENESLYLNMNFGELYENFNRIFVANDSIKQCATTLLTLILEEGTGLSPEEILRKCKDVPYYFCLRRKDLTSINIPSNIKTIYGCAFDHCQSLTNINIENGVKSIGSFAFNDTGIEHVVIPDSVTYMGDFAFASCPRLTQVIFGEGLTEIAHAAFRSCKSLADVKFSDTISIIKERAFKDCTSLEVIDTRDTRIVELGAFENCSNLTRVYFGKDLEVIKSKTFVGCFKLADIFYQGPVKDFCIGVDINKGWLDSDRESVAIHGEDASTIM